MTPAAGFHDLLLAWFASARRPLAWRATRDPYAVLVSEVMLQQTQATRVEPAWRRFLTRFPTVEALAAATPAAVVTSWQGLGYNRRAVSLQRAARAIMRDHGGRVPDDLDALRALPGVGAYTARAVLAFAFGEDAAPVDTNVSRVLSRAVAGRPLTRRRAQQLADDLLPPGRARQWNAALMDLGALVCTARTPACRDCPLATGCAWRASGRREDPAAAGAGPSRRPRRFAGSDRYHRGRLVDALRRGAVTGRDVPAAADLTDRGRASSLADGLVADGLAEWDGRELRLPEV